MKGQRYTDEMFDAVCTHVDKHPGCTARAIGEALYLKFHTLPPTLTPTRRRGRIRDWARGILRALEDEGSILAYRQGRTIWYYLIDEEDDDV